MKTPAPEMNNYSELVREHQSALRNTLRRWTGFDHGLADDLAQETFLRAYQKLHQFKGDARFSTWLYRIAFTIFLNHKAKNPHQMSSLEDTSEGVHCGGMHQVKASHDIERAFAQLSDAQQLCVHLCLQREFSHSEAAEKSNKQFNLELWVIVLALLAGIAIALLNFPIAALGIWLADQNTVLLQLAKMLASSVGLLLITGWTITAASCGWSLMQLR